jgi:hypothetical protein
VTVKIGGTCRKSTLWRRSRNPFAYEMQRKLTSDPMYGMTLWN